MSLSTPLKNKPSVARQYIRDVLEGKITVCKWVRLFCERHVRDLQTGEARNLLFDEDAGARILHFFDFLNNGRRILATLVVSKTAIVQNYNFYDDDAYWELWEGDDIEDGCIGARIATRRYIYDERWEETISSRFSPYVSLPEGFTDWVQYYSYSSDSLIRINAALSKNLDFLVLSEQNSTSTLQYSLSSIFRGLETLGGFSRYVQVSNYCNTKALSDDGSFYTEYLHVIRFPNRYSADKQEFHDFSVLILKSTLTQ